MPHTPLNCHPTIHNDDPAEVWAYRRIALPIYGHFLAETGSRITALGWLSRWVRAVTGPENAVYLTGGRGLLMQGWGQCGEMSLLLQQLASSVDHAARYSFVIGDVNCESWSGKISGSPLTGACSSPLPMSTQTPESRPRMAG